MAILLSFFLLGTYCFPLDPPPPGKQALPVVIWHGLGDSYDSPSLLSYIRHVKEELGKDTFVYSIRLSESGSKDQQASLFGNLNEELAQVHEQLSQVTELANGFNAIGFSQGGLFLRAYNQRYGSSSSMRMHTLVTFGSPHNGIADLPACQPREFFCKRRNQLLRQGVWSDYAQTHVTTAQYFRNPDHLDVYYEKSNFLVDINNEDPNSTKNATYAENNAQLKRLVLIMFDDDETVVPKQSAWFQEFNSTSYVVTPLEDRDLYRQDWLGLKSIPSINYLLFPGVHMEISHSDFSAVVRKYLSPSSESPTMFSIQ